MRRTIGVVVSVMVTLVLLAGAALPVDAALPLRQKRCGALITSSFKLKNNLTCRGDGLKVRANGITIDLNGKRLKGDGDEGDFGIDNSRGFDRVKIISGPGPRGTVDGFYVGIEVGAGAQRNLVRGIGVLGATSDGIDFEGGNGHRILLNRVGFTGDEGIELNGNGARIEGNYVTATDDNGIKVVGDANLIGFNIIEAVDGAGIWIEGSINTIAENQVEDTLGDGIRIEAGSSNDVSYNRVCGTSGSPVFDNGDATTIVGTTAVCP